MYTLISQREIITKNYDFILDKKYISGIYKVNL